jgi:hypothetical protein
VIFFLVLTLFSILVYGTGPGLGLGDRVQFIFLRLSLVFGIFLSLASLYGFILSGILALSTRSPRLFFGVLGYALSGLFGLFSAALGSFVLVISQGNG